VTQVKRGDIVRVTFPSPEDTFDGEFESPHPAIVLQNTSANNKLRSTVVIPVTSGSDPHHLREVRLTPERDGVENDSIALLPKISCVSIQGRIKDESDNEAAWREGEISGEAINEIEQKLSYLLEI
jgi:mRNA-degrading endonuclease toxin of MazEF toxin-antitoxin module